MLLFYFSIEQHKRVEVVLIRKNYPLMKDSDFFYYTKWYMYIKKYYTIIYHIRAKLLIKIIL